MLLLESVGDIFEKDQAKHDMLVLSRIHAPTQGVGHLPQLGFITDIGAVRILSVHAVLWHLLNLMQRSCTVNSPGLVGSMVPLPAGPSIIAAPRSWAV